MKTDINTLVVRYDHEPLAVITDIIVKSASQFTEPTQIQPFKARGLWDTGAQMCAISSSLVRTMGLKMIGTVDVGGFGGERSETPYYRIDITLQDGQHFYSVAVAEFTERERQAHDIILGMNLITKGDFTLAREGKGTRFTFKIDKETSR
jgi:hypothetical protein